MKEARTRQWPSYMAMVTTAVGVLSFTACSKRTEHNVFDLPCGRGRLVLHEDHVTTFETTYVTFELRYLDGKNTRLVDKLKPGARLYVAPTAVQNFQHFRRNSTDDPWPIFVSPNRFSLAEYEQIRHTLQSNLGVIDEAVSRPRKPLEHFGQDRRPIISSVRYIDYEALRHTYGGRDKDTELTVEPDGSVWLGQAWSGGGTSKTVIGFANEKQVLLAPYGSRLTQTSSDKNIYTQANVQQWKAKNGHTIFDDFEVQVARTDIDFEAAMAKRRRTNAAH